MVANPPKAIPGLKSAPLTTAAICGVAWATNEVEQASRARIIFMLLL
jgi:hypothetical protein